MKIYQLALAAMLTTAALGGCAAGPHSMVKHPLEPCVPKDPVARCVTGEELSRYGPTTDEALRIALWTYLR